MFHRSTSNRASTGGRESGSGSGNGDGNGNDTGHGKSPLMKRAVVSSFLYKFVNENGQLKPKVALFKRSGQVRTYQ